MAQATGVRLSMTDPAAVLRLAAEGLGPDFKTSMLQSLERGTKTEIDAVNDAVVRAGRAANIPTPVNDTLVACVTGIERAMADRLDRRHTMTVIERYWDDACVGDEGTGPTYTVTKEAILAFADLSGDHTPVHVDEEYAIASHFGGLVAHGLFGLAIFDGLKTQSDYRFLPGMSLGWTWDFRRADPGRRRVAGPLPGREHAGQQQPPGLGHRGARHGADQDRKWDRGATEASTADGAAATGGALMQDRPLTGLVVDDYKVLSLAAVCRPLPGRRCRGDQGRAARHRRSRSSARRPCSTTSRAAIFCAEHGQARRQREPEGPAWASVHGAVM